ncbi:MAG: sulfatase-like hydrolase/transferase [Vicinamibacterales bacterium]
MRYRSSTAQPLPHGVLRGWNVLLVSIDTLRIDRVGAYGSTRGLTPTVDGLARGGLRFDTTYATVPLTLPSHTSLMTGLYPTRHGVRDNGSFRFDGAKPTLASTLKASGYRTGAFVGAFVVDARFGLNAGFDRYDDEYGSTETGTGTLVVERPAAAVVARATAWIAEQSGPWFAWVHFYDPHEPYAPPEPYRSRIAEPYDGEVAYADAQLGVLLDALRGAGRLDRTLVVVVADHGEALGDHGERTHGLFVYESTMRVPFVLSAPGVVRAGVFPDMARLVDVGPTTLDMLGVGVPEGLDGQSLRPFVAGERQYEERGAYVEALNANLTRNWAPLTGLVRGGFKLIDLPVPELYDLGADASETRNLYAHDPERVRRLERELDTIVRPPEAGSVDAETAARLKSLGYLTAPAATAKATFTADDDPKALVEMNAELDRAVELADGGQVAPAVELLRRIIARRPNLTLAYDRLGQVYARSGRLVEAIDLLEGAARAGFADAPLLAALGDYLQEAGRFGRAVDVLQSALALNPSEVDAYEKLGVTYTRMGRAADAQAMFDKVLSIDPSSVATLNNLGSLYLTTRDYPRAIEVLTRAIALDPNRATAHNGLGVAYAQTGRMDLAIERWQEAVALEPRAVDTLYNLGIALQRARRLTEARPYFERFVEVAPVDRYGSDIERVKRLLRDTP